VVVWWCGGVVVWWCGGVVVWCIIFFFLLDMMNRFIVVLIMASDKEVTK
jgi:hypothetical protein